MSHKRKQAPGDRTQPLRPNILRRRVSKKEDRAQLIKDLVHNTILLKLVIVGISYKVKVLIYQLETSIRATGILTPHEKLRCAHKVRFYNIASLVQTQKILEHYARSVGSISQSTTKEK